MKTVLITGDRNWTDLEMVTKVLKQHLPIALVIHGGQRGADSCGGLAAKALGIPVKVFYANWRLHKLAAGPIRNTKMLTEGKPDVVLAFHNDLAKSKGTKDMVRKVRAIKLPVYLNGEPYQVFTPGGLLR